MVLSNHIDLKLVKASNNDWYVIGGGGVAGGGVVLLGMEVPSLLSIPCGKK